MSLVWSEDAVFREAFVTLEPFHEVWAPGNKRSSPLSVWTLWIFLTTKHVSSQKKSRCESGKYLARTCIFLSKSSNLQAALRSLTFKLGFFFYKMKSIPLQIERRSAPRLSAKRHPRFFCGVILKQAGCRTSQQSSQYAVSKQFYHNFFLFRLVSRFVWFLTYKFFIIILRIPKKSHWMNIKKIRVTISESWEQLMSQANQIYWYCFFHWKWKLFVFFSVADRQGQPSKNSWNSTLKKQVYCSFNSSPHVYILKY